MQTLVPWMVANTAVAMALALVAWGCGRWGRPALAHAVWLLVLVKLVTPQLWRVEVVDARETTRTVVAVAAAAAPRIAVSHEPAAPASAKPRAAEAVTFAPLVMSSPVSRPSFTMTQVLAACWLLGSCCALVLATYRVLRFARILRRATRASAALVEEVKDLASRMGVWRIPRVDVVDAPLSPMLWFIFGRPRLILPRELLDRMTADQRAGVIAHELAHLKRRDHWVRMFELLVTIALWWHPLVWVARRGLREAEEQCCDAWAVSVLPQGRRDYADALVDALEMIGRPPRLYRLPVGATGLGQLGSLRRRLAMIVTQPVPKSVSFSGRALVALLLGVVVIAPVRGQAPAPQPADPGTAGTATTTTTVDDETRRAVLALLEAAQDRDPSVSQAAHVALSQFGPSTIPVLAESLADARTAPFAMHLIAQQGPAAIDALLGSLESRDADVRARALQALEQIVMPGGMPGGMAAVPGGSFAMMEDPAMMSPFGAGGAMPQSGDFVTRLIGPVSRVAKDEDANVRAAAVQLLAKMATVKPDAALVDPLVAAVKDPNIDVRRAAALGLGRLGPLAGGAVDALASAVTDRDAALRVSALEALASMGPNAKGAMATVVAALKAPEPQIRSAAARALGAMHAQPQPAFPGVDPALGVPAPAPGFTPSAPPGRAPNAR